MPSNNRVIGAGLGSAAALAVLIVGPASLRPVSAAAAASLTVDQISLETRYYPYGSPGSTGAAIVAFNNAPTNVGGYSNAPVLLNSLYLKNNQSLGGSPSSIAYHFQIDVTSTGSSIVGFRFGADFGHGGTFLVDGTEVQARWSDMWWNFNFSNPNQFLQGVVTLSAGQHVIDVYGFEGCCDGPSNSQLDIGNGWQTISLGTFEPPPPPDTNPPAVTCSASPAQVWPPNHKMIPIGVQVDVTDDESGPNGFVLEAVTSNEADNGLGDGDSPNDIQNWTLNTPDTSGAFRAERSGTGSGRVYTLTYRGFDESGNSATCSTQVTVPHSK